MHKKIIEEATHEQLKDFAYKVFDMLKRPLIQPIYYRYPEIYDEIEIDLYKEVYECHFNKWLLEKALSKMINDDGTIGGHFKLDQTIMMARSNGIDFKTFNEYDFNYVINMLYSDFYGSVPNETSTYVKMAKKFLDDKDAREGKALRYYLSIK